MTFGTYVLNLRRRLQDLRTLSGTTITAITQDGIRWSSTEIIEIANGALAEAVRTVNSYPASPLVASLATNLYIAPGTISTIGTTGMTDVLDASVLQVLTVENATRPYGRISPQLYTQYLLDLAEPRAGEYFFTVMYDASAGGRKIYILPKGNAVALTYSYIYVKATYTNSDTLTTMHLQGLDDFILDLAEREARDREHNWERSQILDNRIAFKLGVAPRQQ